MYPTTKEGFLMNFSLFELLFGDIDFSAECTCDVNTNIPEVDSEACYDIDTECDTEADSDIFNILFIY
jgi:hypothetical protein